MNDEQRITRARVLAGGAVGLRAQTEDALDLVTAYIAARAAHDKFRDYAAANPYDVTGPEMDEWHATAAHADELLELYVGRYGATR